MSRTQRWSIDGEWIVAFSTGTRLARVTPGGLALWDKQAHREVQVDASELVNLLHTSAPEHATDEIHLSHDPA